ncbi:MAG TPA: metallophosphoesterase [Geobacteraceae bacterium]|nr:metallophosphoesterase [Geobacteraceae bacterium]
MSLFLLTFFLIYGGVHVYTFLRVRSVLTPGPAATACMVLFLALMAFAPILVRLAEKSGLELTARMLAYTGYCWMGLLFLFFSASLAIDLYRLLMYSAGLVAGRNFSSLIPSDRTAFLVASFYAVCTAVYGYLEALDIRTERVVLKSPRIPVEIGRITVAQISDVHLGLIVRTGRLQRIVRLINAAKPDILVSTGDLVDGQINDLSPLVEALREIKPKYGKFAVTGNHEYYAGFAQAMDFTEKAGFRVLHGEKEEVAGITVAGVDDPAGFRMGLGRTAGERELLGPHQRSRFTLLLKHRPDVEKDSAGRFDLQLSGHIHGGQIFPFSLVTRFFYATGTGCFRLDDNSVLYVSRGTGTWGPPIRFLAPPEVTVFELEHGD